MTVEQVEEAARLDTDAPPLTRSDFARLKRVPRVKTIRRALGLTQEEFSVRYDIPVGTLRDWEQGRTKPDSPARAYLRVIARDPQGTQRLAAKASPRQQSLLPLRGTGRGLWGKNSTRAIRKLRGEWER